MNLKQLSQWRNLRVRMTWSIPLAVMLSLVLGGCAAAPTTVEGAWLGKGEFHTTYGSKDVVAQLELLSNGTYRFMILKPSLLALTGAEQGTWAAKAQSLVLTRDLVREEAAASSGVFSQLRKGSGATPPKKMTVSTDLLELKFNDGKMDLIFERNSEATEKLRASGEVQDKQ